MIGPVSVVCVGAALESVTTGGLRTSRERRIDKRRLHNRMCLTGRLILQNGLRLDHRSGLSGRV